MPREGAIIVRDIVGKLAVPRIECNKCGRAGRYRVDWLIERYGIDAKLFEWSDEMTADLRRKQAANLNDICILPRRVGRGNDLLDAHHSNTITETLAILCCRDNRKGGSCQRQLCREAA
jgi:hypothetical protein